MNDVIQVTAIWDEEARVWVAESGDVPGLITEAGTLEQLVSKLESMVPELLELNGISLGQQVSSTVLAREITRSGSVP